MKNLKIKARPLRKSLIKSLDSNGNVLVEHNAYSIYEYAKQYLQKLPLSADEYEDKLKLIAKELEI